MIAHAFFEADKQEALQSVANKPSRALYWMSRVGKILECGRWGVYSNLDIPQEPPYPRIMRVFRNGSYVDQRLKEQASLIVPNFKNVDMRLEYEILPGHTVSGKIDGMIDPSPYGKTIVEFKGLSTGGYNRGTVGDIDITYQVQAVLYALASDAKAIDFVIEHKETQQIIEILYVKDGEAFTASIERYRDSALLDYVTIENAIPFNLIDDLKERLELVKSVSSIEDAKKIFTVPHDPWKCHNCDGQGFKVYKKGSAPCNVCKGTGLEPEPKLLYPCSYCPYKSVCFPNQKMEIEGGKPVFYLKTEGE